MIGDQAATDTAFAKAKHHVKLRIENNRLTPVSMEPRTAIGDYNTAEDSYTLYTSSQNPHGARTEIAHIFHIAENQLRVVSPDVGGGFGLKGGPFPDDALVLWASKKLRRPVKWVATRSEAMMTDHTGRDLVSYGELALDEKGKILAIRSQSLFQVGAYFVGPGMVSGLFSMRFIPEAYDVQAIHVMCKGLFTNTPQAGPYRGAGRPEAAYFTERMIEHAAKQIGMDVAEIRRINLISSDKFPYNTPTWYCYDSGEFVRLLDKCIDMADWKVTRSARRSSKRPASRAAARPLATSSLAASSTTAWISASIRVARSRCSAARTRTGRATRRCSHSSFMNSSACRSNRSAMCRATPPRYTWTRHLRSAQRGGWRQCARRAADAIIDKGKSMAAAMVEADAATSTKDGNFKVVGTDKTIPLVEVAKASFAPMGPMTKFGIGLEGSGSHSPEPPSHPNGARMQSRSRSTRTSVRSRSTAT